MIAEAVQSLMRERNRVMWENLPSPSKKLVFQVVGNELDNGMDKLADDIHDNFERLLDLRELVVRKCEEFSRVFTEEILTAREVVHTMIHGVRKERTLALLRTHVSEIMENKVVVQHIAQAAMGPEGYADLKDAALAGWGQLILLFGERLLENGAPLV